MARKSLLISFGIGMFVGMLATVALSGGHVVPRAVAQDRSSSPQQTQPEAAAEIPRYTMGVYCYPGLSGYAPSHGAYILDTVSGKSWIIREGGAPKALFQWQKP